jgi:competence protein ComGC
MSSTRFLAAPVRAAFTIVELLVVILIIVVLMGLLLPAIAMVRNSVNKGAGDAMVTSIHMAMDVYFQEEPRKRFPPVEADGTLKTNMVVAGPKLTLDLLRDKGLEWRMDDHIDSTSGALIDPWGRTYMYRLDDNMDGTADKPAAHDEWNGKGREPYAYVWCYGKPVDATDTTPAAVDRWLFKHTLP